MLLSVPMSCLRYLRLNLQCTSILFAQSVTLRLVIALVSRETIFERPPRKLTLDKAIALFRIDFLMCEYM